MVLHLPGIVVVEFVGELHLRQSVLVKLPFIVLRPGSRQLQLIKNAELHDASPLVSTDTITCCSGAKYERIPNCEAWSRCVDCAPLPTARRVIGSGGRASQIGQTRLRSPVSGTSGSA